MRCYVYADQHLVALKLADLWNLFCMFFHHLSVTEYMSKTEWLDITKLKFERRESTVTRLKFIFAGDLAAVRIIEMSVIARCPQGESRL